MDTMYSNKKYLQSLTAGSDFYRSSSSVRPMTNDYTSYQNTIGRRSTLGPYTHMSKYSYPTDVSLSSHYGYNSWGIWRDTRNISPSAAFTKKQRNIKSFSIILMTAAFIVVLAVLSVAGLAFYFSTFKSDIDDSILVFDGSFRVSRGDVYTTGLKYNHTSVYRQKSEYYEKFIRSAFENHGLIVSRCDLAGFGDGPLIHPVFRVFLDMRKIPMTINNVEQHIATSLMDEIASTKSAYKNLKIDPDTIDIKRLLDQDVLRNAFAEKDTSFNNQNSSSAYYEEKLFKKTGVIEKSIHRFSSNTKQRPTPKPINESDVDLENLPVIQGSFEVTKTDADITQRKLGMNSVISTSTLRPIVVSPAVFKVKEPIKHTGYIEKVTTKMPFIKETPKINKGDILRVTEETTPISTTVMNLPSKIPIVNNSGIENVTVPILSTVMTSESTNLIPIGENIPPTETVIAEVDGSAKLEKTSNVLNPPKLDVTLFTSAPVLDNEPWRPISHSSSNNGKEVMNLPTIKPNTSPSKLPNKEINLLKNKSKYSEPFIGMFTDNPNRPVYYKSFTNPAFSTGTMGIERLGTADLKPYPIPVNKLIIESTITADKNLNDTSTNLNNEGVTDNKFEYLGGGVLVKKPEILTISENGTIDELTSSETPIISTIHSVVVNVKEINQPTSKDHIKIIHDNKNTTQYASSHLGEMLYELLEIKDHSRFDPIPDKKPTLPEMEVESKLNFQNIREMVLASALNRSLIPETTTEDNDLLTAEISAATYKRIPTLEFRNIPSEVEAEDDDDDYSSEEELVTFSTVSDSTSSSYKEISSSTTEIPSYVAVDALQHNPVSWDQSSLFPIHPKWEFVNGSLIASHHDNNTMKKVFNETLQALVVENMQVKGRDKTPDIKIEKNNQENLQNLSSIFDTLSTKLGITPNIPSKAPPFSTSSQNKYRVNKPLRTTTTLPTVEMETMISKESMEQTSEETIPILLEVTPEGIGGIGEAEIGEAEIEEIDPLKFEEFLKEQAKVSTRLSTTTTAPPLVTLLPVKSNSGIRILRPRPVNSMAQSTDINRRLKLDSMEAIVRTAVNVNSK